MEQDVGGRGFGVERQHHGRLEGANLPRRHRRTGFPDHGCGDVVAQMLSEVRQFRDDRYAVSAQFGRRPEARDHHQLRRLDCAAGENDAAAGENDALIGLDANGLPAIAEDALRHAPRSHLQMRRQLGKRVQIGNGGGLAQAAARIEREEANPGAYLPGEVHVGQAEFASGVQEGAAQRMAGRGLDGDPFEDARRRGRVPARSSPWRQAIPTDRSRSRADG